MFAYTVIKFPSILFYILFAKNNKVENVLNALKTGKTWIFNFNYIEKYIFHSIGREEGFKMVYFSSNSDYFEDFSKFSMQNIKRYSITLEKLVFFMICVENLIFQ